MKHVIEKYKEFVLEYLRALGNTLRFFSILAHFSPLTHVHIHTSHTEDAERSGVQGKYLANAELAACVLEYLDTHDVDPDGATLGLAPSDRLVKECLPILPALLRKMKEKEAEEASLTNPHPNPPPKPRSPPPLNSLLSKQKAKPHQPPVDSLSLTKPRRRDVVTAILELSEMDDAAMVEQIQMYGRVFADELLLCDMWRHTELHSGDLVLVLLLPSQITAASAAQPARSASNARAIKALAYKLRRLREERVREKEWDREREKVPGREEEDAMTPNALFRIGLDVTPKSHGTVRSGQTIKDDAVRTPRRSVDDTPVTLDRPKGDGKPFLRSSTGAESEVIPRVRELDGKDAPPPMRSEELTRSLPKGEKKRRRWMKRRHS